ncbi:STAS domain-containing protein [Microbispora rosea]|uniref:STAS domain-containing protein n=1 Tax=Microbispora rosea TaxID=58117 RepID=UPI00342C3AC3
MGRLHIVVGHKPPHAVLALDGELDVATAPHLDDAFVREYEAGYRKVILDVGALRFCDSYGLRMLLRLQDRCVADGGRMVLADTRGMLARVLNLTGLERALVQFETVERATAEL